MIRKLAAICALTIGPGALVYVLIPAKAQEFHYPKGMPKKWGQIRSCFANGKDVACVLEDSLGFVRIVSVSTATGETEKITEFWRP